MYKKFLLVMLAIFLLLTESAWAGEQRGPYYYDQLERIGVTWFSLATNTYQQQLTGETSLSTLEYSYDKDTWTPLLDNVTYYAVSPVYNESGVIVAVANGQYQMIRNGWKDFEPMKTLPGDFKMVFSPDGKLYYAYNANDRGRFWVANDSQRTWSCISESQFSVDGKAPYYLTDIAVGYDGQIWLLATNTPSNKSADYKIFTSWDEGRNFKILPTDSYANLTVKDIFDKAKNGDLGDDFKDPTNPNVNTNSEPNLETKNKVVKFILGQSSYMIDNTEFAMDAVPYADNGRAMVPVRYLANSLGITDIKWDDQTQTVTLIKDGKTVSLVVGSDIINTPNVGLNMDVAPQFKSGRIYLSAKYIAEAFGYQITWDQASQTITVQ